MSDKKWIVVSVLCVVAFFGVGFYVGTIGQSAKLDAALAKYDTLRAADNALMGRLGETLGGAIKRSEQLRNSGAGLEQSARRVAVLAQAVNDSIVAIVRDQKERGSSDTNGGGVSPSP